MAKKSTSKPSLPRDAPSTSTTSSSSDDDDKHTDLTPVKSLSSSPSSSSEIVNVNNANLTEIKTALDDVIRNYLNHAPQSYTQSHRHTDTKLALGWAAALIALGTTAWSTRVDWETSKFPLTLAVGAYVILSLLQTAYAHFIELDTIYVGKRKAFAPDGRIETSHITVTSRTDLLPPPKRTPTYAVQLSCSSSTNAGKSLLSRTKKTGNISIGQFVSEGGEVDVVGVEAWVKELSESGSGGAKKK